MCSCDLEQPKVMSRERLKGRKDHKCSECRKVIPAGTEHEVIKGLWEIWQTFRTCDTCIDLRDLCETEPCACIPLGGLYEFAREAEYLSILR